MNKLQVSYDYRNRTGELKQGHMIFEFPNIVAIEDEIQRLILRAQKVSVMEERVIKQRHTDATIT